MQLTNQLDPAATDAPGENSRNGAKKRRDPNEPSAVVGLGASAGGVAPLQQFFGDMNPESGLAFVVVMHLSPEFESAAGERDSAEDDDAGDAGDGAGEGAAESRLCDSAESSADLRRQHALYLFRRSRRSGGG